MNTDTKAAEMKDTLSITVLSLVLAASNVLALYLVSHYTDVLGRIF